MYVVGACRKVYGRHLSATHQSHELLLLGVDSLLEVRMASQELLHCWYGVAIVLLPQQWFSQVHPGIQLLHLVAKTLQIHSTNQHRATTFFVELLFFHNGYLDYKAAAKIKPLRSTLGFREE